MSLIRQFAIRNELLYSGFVLPNVQIFFVQKISFATFGVSIDDFFTRYAGLGYSLPVHKSVIAMAAINDYDFELIEHHLIHLVSLRQTFIYSKIENKA